MHAYREGSVHNVYYQPSDPSIAYLERGIHPRSFLTLLIGSLCSFVGVFFAAFSYLLPKYGQRMADGSFHLPFSHPISKAAVVGFLLLFLQIALAVWITKHD